MLRTRLLTTAAVAAAIMAAPAAFAQSMQPGVTPQAAPPASTTQAAPAATAPTPQTVPAQEQPAAQANSVIDVLRASGQFSTLLTALDQAQLTQTLASRPKITIFAPTDAAFAALPEVDRTRLLDPANAQELRNLLLYHVIVADVSEDQIKGAAGPVETAGGSRVQIDGSGEAIKVDGATVTQAELDASNGGVFVIDKVLMPNAGAAAQGDDAPAPAAGSATMPAANGTTAPNGQPAATTTTTASPPVANPTDGQVDATGRTTPPVQTPEASDGQPNGTEPSKPATPPSA